MAHPPGGAHGTPSHLVSRPGSGLAPLEGRTQSLLDFGGSPSRIQTANAKRSNLLSSTSRSTAVTPGQGTMRGSQLMQTTNVRISRVVGT